MSRTFVSGSACVLHFGHCFLVCSGSTGSSFSSGKIILLHLLHFHIGIGTPKCLFLDIDQSHSNPLTQFSYLLNMNWGCHLIFFASLIKIFFLFSNLMNHCSVGMNSISVPHLS